MRFLSGPLFSNLSPGLSSRTRSDSASLLSLLVTQSSATLPIDRQTDRQTEFGKCSIASDLRNKANRGTASNGVAGVLSLVTSQIELKDTVSQRMCAKKNKEEAMICVSFWLGSCLAGEWRTTFAKHTKSKSGLR